MRVALLATGYVTLALAASTPPVVAASALDQQSLDDQWRAWLDTPPAVASEAAANLTARAEQIARAVPAEHAISGDIDVVVSGGGNYDAYYMGISMVLARAAARNASFRMLRFAGASAGGMLPFELLLKGEHATLVTHLAYGLLEEAWPTHYSLALLAAALQDHHWRMMASWQSAKYNATLSALDGRVYLATSCLDPLPKLVKISEFTSPAQASAAFMSTGTVAEWYNGMLCSDGGSMSGPRMTPLFQDGLRPQLIVDLMRCGFPLSMAEGKYTAAQFSALCAKGQDDAAEFLRSGAVGDDGIALCPVGAKVSGNVCDRTARDAKAAGAVSSVE